MGLSRSTQKGQNAYSFSSCLFSEKSWFHGSSTLMYYG